MLGNARILFAVTSLALTSASHAGLLFSHSGNSNPAGEGWSLLSGLGTPVLAPVTNDNGTGQNAWKIDTDEGFAQLYATYIRSWSAAEQQRLLTSPVSFQMKLRIVTDTLSGATYDIASWLEYANKGLQLNLGIEPGQLRVATQGNTIYLLRPGPNDYHTFEFRDADGNGQFDFYIDGTLTVSNFSPAATVENRVTMGDGYAGVNGNAEVNWAEVLVYVPEPASLSVLAVGCVALSRRKRA